jgi:hypothetical protein
MAMIAELSKEIVMPAPQMDAQLVSPDIRKAVLLSLRFPTTTKRKKRLVHAEGLLCF